MSNHNELQKHEAAAPRTSIMVGKQAMMRGPGYLYDLLIQAGSLLLYAANQQQWPADLQPASRRRDEP
jgi:hypothetical protein